MKSLQELIAEAPSVAAKPRVTAIRERSTLQATPEELSVHTEQIEALVQQLFFRHEMGPVRHVGFAPVEPSMSTTQLCFDVAKTLAQEEGCEVGLVDASSDSQPLQTQLQIPPPTHELPTWAIAPRLWMVPRHSWLGDSKGQRITEHHLLRLRELTAEFDFSILWCPPVSWLTASMGQACDGLVLVLAANKTRRLVAAQIKDQLRRAQIPLLGTVLAERRFPIPQGLYRSL
jgi:hypothetical protein